MNVGQAITAALQEQAQRDLEELFPQLWLASDGLIHAGSVDGPLYPGQVVADDGALVVVV